MADVMSQRKKWTEASTGMEGVTSLLFTGVIGVYPKPKKTAENYCGKRRREAVGAS